MNKYEVVMETSMCVLVMVEAMDGTEAMVKAQNDEGVVDHTQGHVTNKALSAKLVDPPTIPQLMVEMKPFDPNDYEAYAGVDVDMVSTPMIGMVDVPWAWKALVNDNTNATMDVVLSKSGVSIWFTHHGDTWQSRLDCSYATGDLVCRSISVAPTWDELKAYGFSTLQSA